jgi:hypothetical protein
MDIIRSNVDFGPTVKHGFFTRDGGVSDPPYDSLNVNPDCGDDPENVEKNREILADLFDLPTGELAYLTQEHGAKVVSVKTGGHAGQGDCLITATRETGLLIKTADCVPVLMSDPRHGVIGAVHVGWRGALQGVVQSAVDAMSHAGAARVVAAMGPSIRQPNYEVGPELRQEVLDQYSDADKYFALPQTFGHERSGNWYFDLPKFVYDLLEEAGVETVEDTGHDTYTNKDRFFSCRRTKHETQDDFGCQASVIMLE